MSAVTPPDAETLLEALRAEHPRLILTNERLAALKTLAETDETLQALAQRVISQAERVLDEPPLEYRLIGPRLLHVSRQCLRRVYALGLAYRWTGERKYADTAIENLLTVCAFPDWNPSHFLDTAEMSHAVGLGYDWLFDLLDEDAKAAIRDGLIRNGLELGVAAYRGEGPSHWWRRSEYNWNQVCNGGLIVGALAIAETDPDYAQAIVTAAVESLPLALSMYGPDGAWGEGPGYWNYATRYTAYGIAALETALGTDFGLTDEEGLAQAGSFPIYAEGPTGLYLNYADSGERAGRRPQGVMFWLARAFNNAAYAASERRQLEERGGGPEHLIWYVEEPADFEPPTLDKRYRGDVPIAVFRSAWDDPNALFVGVKAGYNQVNHGHLDLGNFELDALGVRWSRDLGSDNYNMPGYWQGRRGGQRWTYYRLNSFSHSVPLVNGENQDPDAHSELSRFRAGDDMPFAQIDFTEAYADAAISAVRGIALIDGRRAALVQDEFTLKSAADITWAMTTDADIEIDGAEARLTQDGKTLIARALSPGDAQFEWESAEQEPPEKRNEGVRRLLLRIIGARGETRVAVQFAPVWEGGASAAYEDVAPLAEW